MPSSPHLEILHKFEELIIELHTAASREVKKQPKTEDLNRVKHLLNVVEMLSIAFDVPRIRIVETLLYWGISEFYRQEFESIDKALTKQTRRGKAFEAIQDMLTKNKESLSESYIETGDNILETSQIKGSGPKRVII